MSNGKVSSARKQADSWKQHQFKQRGLQEAAESRAGCAPRLLTISSDMPLVWGGFKFSCLQNGHDKSRNNSLWMWWKLNFFIIQTSRHKHFLELLSSLRKVPVISVGIFEVGYGHEDGERALAYLYVTSFSIASDPSPEHLRTSILGIYRVPVLRGNWYLM